LSGFNHTKIKTNPKVLAFYEKMPTLTPEIMASAEDLLNTLEKCASGGGGNVNGVKLVKI